MHKRILVVFLLVSAGTASAELGVSFHAPAQTSGPVHGENWTWMLIVFAPADEAEFHVDSQQDATVANSTYHRRQIYVEAAGHGYAHSSDTPLPVEVDTWKGRQAHASPAPGLWSSVLVKADSLVFDMEGDGGRVDTVEEGTEARHLLDQNTPWWTHHPGLSIPEGGIVFSQGAGGFSATALGELSIEWHGMKVDCPGDCIDGGHMEDTRYDHESRKAWSEFRSYIRTSTYGEIHANGDFYGVLVGGGVVDVVVEQIRLPLAVFHGSCTACNAEPQTMVANGSMSLTGMSPENGQIHAMLDGAPDSLRLDEHAVAASALFGAPLAGVFAGISVGALLLAVLFKGQFVAVLGRICRETVLKQPTRRHVFKTIVKNPGLSANGIAQVASVPRTTVLHHTTLLARAGLIIARGSKSRHAYFENHGRYDSTWRIVAVLSNQENQRLYELMANDEWSMVDICRAAAERYDWARSTTRYRLDKLEEAGLVEKHTGNGRELYGAI